VTDGPRILVEGGVVGCGLVPVPAQVLGRETSVSLTAVPVTGTCAYVAGEIESVSSK
jgi:hypothetical protein